jgi:hypothetical protein
MTATLALQDVLIPHSEFLRDMEACERVGLNPIRFGLIPFTDDITGDIDAPGPIVPFGSTKIIRMAMQGKLPPSWHVFYDEFAFTQPEWAAVIGEAALNYDAVWTRLSQVKSADFTHQTFVKPATDLKAFAGMIVYPGETIEGRLSQTQTDHTLSEHEIVCLAPIKKILSEYRCWVIGEKVVGASRYRDNGRAETSPVEGETLVALSNFIEGLRFSPSRAYVVDVADTPDGPKVVEYNCINCSGRYAVDRGALFIAILDSVGSRP